MLSGFMSILEKTKTYIHIFSNVEINSIIGSKTKTGRNDTKPKYLPNNPGRSEILKSMQSCLVTVLAGLRFYNRANIALDFWCGINYFFSPFFIFLLLIHVFVLNWTFSVFTCFSHQTKEDSLLNFLLQSLWQHGVIMVSLMYQIYLSECLSSVLQTW